jgi:hypothetical protein
MEQEWSILNVYISTLAAFVIKIAAPKSKTMLQQLISKKICFFQNCRLNICQSLKVGFISGRVIPLNANSTMHTAFVSEGTMDSDRGCTTSTFVRNNVEYKYSVETVEVINFLNFLFATHMIYFKIWLLKCFTYNFRQTSP